MIEADVVVIGSGPAGFTVTQILLQEGKSVLVIPGGGWREEGSAEALTGAPSDSAWGHEPLETHRRLAIGGAGDLWGGRSILFDPIDFETRGWVPDSGWPISYEEYFSHFGPAAHLLGIHPTLNHPVPIQETSPPPENEQITASRGGVELWSKETRFSAKWRKLIKTERRLRLLEDAYCVKISTAPTGRVTEVSCVASGEAFTVRGQAYVIATGALENARLLLNAGFGKSLPALGRYYMSHLWFTSYEFQGPSLSPSLDLRRVVGTYTRRRWRLSDSTQEKFHLLNAIAFPGKSPINPLSMHEKSGSSVSRGLVTGGESAPHKRGKSTSGFVRAGLWSHRGVGPISKHALAAAMGWKPPLLLPSRKYGHWALWFQGEHAPNRSSKVELTKASDVFGNRRIRANIDFSDIDFLTAAHFHRYFDALATNHGFVQHAGGEPSPEYFREFIRAKFNSNAHQAGTTRMGTDVDKSVVNADSRVHTSENLYVAGSSVFPTSGHANPTLTIVMLSARLGQHLGKAIGN